MLVTRKCLDWELKFGDRIRIRIDTNDYLFLTYDGIKKLYRERKAEIGVIEKGEKRKGH